MIYTHVLQRGGQGVRCPLDSLTPSEPSLSTRSARPRSDQQGSAQSEARCRCHTQTAYPVSERDGRVLRRSSMRYRRSSPYCGMLVRRGDGRGMWRLQTNGQVGRCWPRSLLAAARLRVRPPERAPTYRTLSYRRCAGCHRKGIACSVDLWRRSPGVTRCPTAIAWSSHPARLSTTADRRADSTGRRRRRSAAAAGRVARAAPSARSTRRAVRSSAARRLGEAIAQLDLATAARCWPTLTRERHWRANKRINLTRRSADVVTRYRRARRFSAVRSAEPKA